MKWILWLQWDHKSKPIEVRCESFGEMFAAWHRFARMPHGNPWRMRMVYVARSK